MMDYRKLKYDTALVMVGYMLRYASVIVLIPIYGRVLGPANYGKVLAAMSLMNIVWTVVNFGFSVSGARELASTASPEARDAVFARQLAGRAVLIPVGMLIGLVGTLESATLRETPLYGALATLIGLFSAFNLGWYFQGVRRFRTSILTEAITYPLNVLFVLILVRKPDDGMFVLISILTSYAVYTIVAYGLALRSVSLGAVTPRGVIEEMKTGTIFFLQSLSTIAVSSLLTYILSIRADASEVGYFGVAERFIALGTSLFGPIGQVLMPTICNSILLRDGKAGSLVRVGIGVELAIGLCMSVGAMTLSRLIFPLMFGDRFDHSIELFNVMCLVFPFSALSHAISLYVFVPNRRERQLVLALCFGALADVILATVAADRGGAYGVAVVRVVGEMITVASLLAMLYRNRSGELGALRLHRLWQR